MSALDLIQNMQLGHEFAGGLFKDEFQQWERLIESNDDPDILPHNNYDQLADKTPTTPVVITPYAERLFDPANNSDSPTTGSAHTVTSDPFGDIRYHADFDDQTESSHELPTESPNCSIQHIATGDETPTADAVQNRKRAWLTVDMSDDEGHSYTPKSPDSSPRYMMHTAESSRFLGLTEAPRFQLSAKPYVPSPSKHRRLKLLIQEMSLLFKDCDRGEKGYLNYAEFGLFLFRAGLLREISRLRYNYLCALTVNLAKQLGHAASSISNDMLQLHQSLTNRTNTSSPFRSLLHDDTLATTIFSQCFENRSTKYTLEPVSWAPSQLVGFPLVETGVTMPEAVCLVAIVSDQTVGHKYLGTKLQSKVSAHSLCTFGTVQRYEMTIEELLQALRINWAARGKNGKPVTFEDVYPEMTFHPKVNDNSLELDAQRRQNLWQRWKAEGTDDHFALFCIKSNLKRTQRRLEEQRENQEAAFKSTFIAAPKVNERSDELAASYRARMAERFNQAPHERFHQEFLDKSKQMENLRLTYQIAQAQIDSNIYTFSPQVGQAPVVISERTLKQCESPPKLHDGQLTVRDLPVPTGYFQEIQRIRDNNELRMRRQMFEQSMQFREYPLDNNVPTKTIVEEFKLLTSQRCEMRLTQRKQNLQQLVQQNSNHRTQSPSPLCAKSTPRSQLKSNTGFQLGNVLHLQIKLGVRKVVTFSIREGDNLQIAVNRFLQQHNIPESAHSLLRKRAEAMMKSAQKPVDGPIKHMPTTDVHLETKHRSRHRKQLKLIQQDREILDEQEKLDDWKRYKERLHVQANNVARRTTTLKTMDTHSPELIESLNASQEKLAPFSPVRSSRRVVESAAPPGQTTPVLAIMVNIDEHRAARLELLEGEDPFNTARRFCIQHGIAYSLYPKIGQIILRERRKIA